jgi:catechol 2,3-dioxygenase-like lactoylglutathione lyase family enzyme
MLGRYDAGVSLAVKNLAAAHDFYVGKLGLLVEKQNIYESMYSSGHVKIQVYESSEAGTNKGTAAFWEVENIEAEVAELRDKGVEFEHYTDISDMQLQGDVHIMDGEKAAWFKDPDGNILSLHSGSKVERLDIQLGSSA